MTWTEPDNLPTKSARRLSYIMERLADLLATLPELRRLAEATHEASEVPGRRPTEHPDDPGIRSLNTPPTDSTSRMATDPARLGAVAARRTADRHLLQAIVHLTSAHQVLSRALDRWDGRR